MARSASVWSTTWCSRTRSRQPERLDPASGAVEQRAGAVQVRLDALVRCRDRLDELQRALLRAEPPEPHEADLVVLSGEAVLPGVMAGGSSDVVVIDPRGDDGGDGHACLPEPGGEVAAGCDHGVGAGGERAQVVVSAAVTGPPLASWSPDAAMR